jgi:pantoate--beta-alanine ligase
LSAALRDGARQADRCSVLEAARRPLTQAEAADPSFRVQYVELVSPASFGPVAEDYAGPAVLAVAAAVGGTRLIDNAMVHLAGAG